MIVGLTGKKGAGKDTAGAYFVERYGFKRVSFAEPLKRSAAALLGVTVDDLEEWKNDPAVRLLVEISEADRKLMEAGGNPIRSHGMNIREYLQRYGTEAHRDIFGEHFWVRQLIDNLKPDTNYVITDARFTNECWSIRSVGGTVIRIERPGTDLADTHASEAPVPDELVDAVIENSGTVDELHFAIDTYMAAILMRQA